MTSRKRRRVAPQSGGHDYGIPERVAILGDSSFPNDFQKHMLGVGYAGPLRYRSHDGVWAFGLTFDSEQGADLCWKHFEGWTSDFTIGDAVYVSFVETGSDYAVCISQDFLRLQERLAPDLDQEFQEPLVLSFSYLHRVNNVSGVYALFKSHILAGGAAIMCPMLVGAGGQPRLGRDAAFEKSQFAFMTDADLQAHPIERALLTADAIGKPNPVKPDRNPKKLAARREGRLSAYFPITLECIKSSSNAEQLLARFASAGHPRWQIVQAICNLSVSARIRTIRPRHTSEPWQFAAGQPETVDDLDTLERSLDSMTGAALAGQIGKDARALIEQLELPSPKTWKLDDVRSCLADAGLL